MIFQNFSIFWGFTLRHVLNMVRVFSILAKFRVKNFFSRIEFRLLIAPPFPPTKRFFLFMPIFSRNTSNYSLITIRMKYNLKLNEFFFGFKTFRARQSYISVISLSHLVRNFQVILSGFVLYFL